MRLNRKKLRRALLWGSLLLMLRLADYSVSAAFLGAEPAQKLFNSFGMFLFWLTLFVLLATTVFLTPLRNFSLSMMHVACGVILLGGVLGSKAAHKILYHDRLYKGAMEIGEGGSSNRVFSPTGELIGELDFEIGLVDFRIDRYLPKDPDKRWEIWSGLKDSNGESAGESVRVDWRVGRRIPVPNTDVTIEVLGYEQREVPRPPGVILIRTQGDGPVTLPAVVGRQVVLPKAKTTITVSRVFRGISIDSKTMRPVDDPSKGFRPAAELELTVDGQPPTTEWAFTADLNAQMKRAVDMSFLPSDNPDMKTLTIPTMKIRLRRLAVVQDRTISPAEGISHDAMSLDFMYPGPGAFSEARSPTLLFRESIPTIKTFESKVVVRDAGREVRRASIRVNHPLHYGGYHFYQSNYDLRGQTFTVLSVVSSRGLGVVYTGFGLLFCGAVWYCWVGYFGRKRSSGRNRKTTPVRGE